MVSPPIRYRDEVRAKYPEHVAACEALETFVVANRPSSSPKDAVEECHRQDVYCVRIVRIQ